MSLTRVLVENFRCIERLSVDLDDTTVLIGENNSGKTAFLDAIRICLDPSSGREQRPFDDYDYRLSKAGASPAAAPPIRIELTFVENEPEGWSEAQVREFDEIIDRDPENRILIRLSVNSSFREGTEWKFLHGARGSAARPRQVALLQRLAPVHYLSALRDAEKNFAPRAPFWRDFLEETGIPAEERAVLERELEALNARVVEKHAPLSSVRRQLEVVTGVIAFAAGEAVSVEALPTRLFSLLSGARVSLAARSGVSIPLHRQGQGTQSLAVLALFAAYLRSRRADGEPEAAPITALEEPEAHLHPAAVRALMRVVKEMPGQTLIATHSGDLMAEVSASWIRRFVPEGDGVAVHRISSDELNQDEKDKFDFHVRRVRGELLFARCWLLVEGETEEILIAAAARAMGMDLDRVGVRIVKFTTAGPAPFVKTARAFGIRWFMVVDDDDAGVKYRRSVAGVVGDEAAAEFVISPYSTPEDCLLGAGFDAIYEQRAVERTRRAPVEAADPAVKTLPKPPLKKPSAAAKVAEIFNEDATRIPHEIRDIVQRVFALVDEA